MKTHKKKYISSTHTEEMRKFMELARNIPDIRQDKINNIRKQIKSGAYSIPAESVAKSIAGLAKLFDDTEEI